MTTDPRHVTADFAIAFIAWQSGSQLRITQDQLRQWATRNHITRIGLDHKGRTIYELGSIIRYTHARGMLTGHADTPPVA